MTPDGVVFVVNPASANGSTGRRWPEIARRAAAAGLEGDALISTRAGEIADLAAQAAGDGARLVVAVGGDGTVYEAVNGLMRAGAGSEVELAILPRGTGKDFMRTFDIPGNLDRAIAIAKDGDVRTIDVGHATLRRLERKRGGGLVRELRRRRASAAPSPGTRTRPRRRWAAASRSFARPSRSSCAGRRAR